MAEPLVDIRGLTKTFGAQRAVDGLSLRLMPGDIIGMVGANGGGKTTTIRIIAGLIRSDAGEGHVLGRDISNGRFDRRHIGYMGQKNALYPELTVRENLAFRVSAYGLPGTVTDDAVVRFGLTHHANTRVERLSGGWQRRAQFAATLLHAPALLLLDEPTAGLDVVARRDLWRWIDEAADAGCGVIVSTHDVVEAGTLPAVLLFDEGRVEGPLAPATLFDAARGETLGTALLRRSSGP